MKENDFNKLEKMITNNFLEVPRSFIYVFKDTSVAIILAELFSEYRYFKDNNKLTEYDSFFSTIENIKRNTGLSRGPQDRCIKKLCDYGIIKVITKGMPAKRYFKFIPSGIEKLANDTKKALSDLKKADKERYNEMFDNSINDNSFDDSIIDVETGEVITNTPTTYNCPVPTRTFDHYTF